MGGKTAHLFFAGELANLLTCSHDSGAVHYPADRSASIKDVVEALGVPHTEVHAILTDNCEHDFSLQLATAKRITFLPADLTPRYPVDVTCATLLRPALETLRFLVDENVAGLVPMLRALGFDSAYDRNWDDEYIASLSSSEGRVVLTRDRGLLKRSSIEHGRLIRSQVVDEQLIEVLRHFKIPQGLKPFSRCLRCNVITARVNKKDILHLLKPKTRAHYHSFRRCPQCSRIYWRGTHYENLVARFRSLGLDIQNVSGNF